MNQPYIVGWGHTPFGKLDNIDLVQLISDAALPAIASTNPATRTPRMLFIPCVSSKCRTVVSKPQTHRVRLAPNRDKTVSLPVAPYLPTSFGSSLSAIWAAAS